MKKKHESILSPELVLAVRGQKKTGSPAVSRLVCVRIGKEKERRGGGVLVAQSSRKSMMSLLAG